MAQAPFSKPGDPALAPASAGSWFDPPPSRGGGQPAQAQSPDLGGVRKSSPLEGRARANSALENGAGLENGALENRAFESSFLSDSALGDSARENTDHGSGPLGSRSSAGLAPAGSQNGTPLPRRGSGGTGFGGTLGAAPGETFNAFSDADGPAPAAGRPGGRSDYRRARDVSSDFPATDTSTASSPAASASAPSAPVPGLPPAFGASTVADIPPALGGGYPPPPGFTPGQGGPGLSRPGLSGPGQGNSGFGRDDSGFGARRNGYAPDRAKFPPAAPGASVPEPPAREPSIPDPFMADPPTPVPPAAGLPTTQDVAPPGLASSPGLTSPPRGTPAEDILGYGSRDRQEQDFRGRVSPAQEAPPWGPPAVGLPPADLPGRSPSDAPGGASRPPWEAPAGRSRPRRSPLAGLANPLTGYPGDEAQHLQSGSQAPPAPWEAAPRADAPPRQGAHTDAPPAGSGVPPAAPTRPQPRADGPGPMLPGYTEPLPGYTEPLRGLPRPPLGQQPGLDQDPGQREMAQPGRPRHGRPGGEPSFGSGSGFDGEPGFDEDDFSDLNFDEADDIVDERYRDERRGNGRPLDEQSRRPGGGHRRRPEGTRQADEDPAATGGVYGGWSQPDDGASRPGRGRHRAKRLVLGGGAIVVAAAVAGTFVVSQMDKHQQDPGCKDYTSDVLPDYNKMINDLNEQAKKPQLTADMTAAVNQLTAAEATSQSSQATTALQALLTQLQTVQKDANKGFVPAVTVRALNSAATKADDAC